MYKISHITSAREIYWRDTKTIYRSLCSYSYLRTTIYFRIYVHNKTQDTILQLNDRLRMFSNTLSK